MTYMDSGFKNSPLPTTILKMDEERSQINEQENKKMTMHKGLKSKR